MIGSLFAAVCLLVPAAVLLGWTYLPAERVPLRPYAARRRPRTPHPAPGPTRTRTGPSWAVQDDGSR